MYTSRTLLISLSLLSCTQLPAEKFLVFGGKTGWVGQKIMTILRNADHEVISADARLENREALTQEINRVNPYCIVNAAGLTGTPNVDWCEDHKQETIRTNIIGTLNLADISCSKSIHLINIGTGCIYEYDEKHQLGSGIGFTEDEAPNFHGSFYSHTKCMLDDLLSNYSNVLNLRLRMPIACDLHPRSFVTKITRYKKVVNVPNSMSVLDDLLALIPEMAKRKLTGNYNFVNPGVISHNQILDLYKKYVDPNFTYENFTIEEQNMVLKSKRSNNHLDASKLLKEFPHVPSITDSVEAIMKQMGNTVKK